MQSAVVHDIHRFFKLRNPADQRSARHLLHRRGLEVINLGSKNGIPSEEKVASRAVWSLAAPERAPHSLDPVLAMSLVGHACETLLEPQREGTPRGD